jgi:hypothetical protein
VVLWLGEAHKQDEEKGKPVEAQKRESSMVLCSKRVEGEQTRRTMPLGQHKLDNIGQLLSLREPADLYVAGLTL